MLAEEIVSGVLNAPDKAAIAGQYAARFDLTGDYDDRDKAAGSFTQATLDASPLTGLKAAINQAGKMYTPAITMSRELPVSGSIVPEVGAQQDLIQVYRGTNRVTENMIFDETGHLLSDAAQRVYMQTGNVNKAYSASQSSHKQWVGIWGNENHYIQAHGTFGTELVSAFGLDKTFISVTTDSVQAAYFAKGSGAKVYGGVIPRSQLLQQTLSGAGESEFLIRNGTKLLTPVK